MVNCNSYVFRRSDNSNKLTKPGNVAPVWLPAAEAGQDLLSNSEYHAAENMACHKILQIPPLPFIGAGTKCKWLKMGFFMMENVNLDYLFCSTVQSLWFRLVSGLTVCFCDKCISSICLCLAGSRSCLMMLCARGLSGSDLSFYPVLITSRAQTTKWGVDSLDRHNTVLSGHQSSQLPPDKLRGLFVPSSSSDRVKFNHRKISCEKICLMIETLNWCKIWVVESEVEVIGIWNREQKVEPC